MITNNNEAFAFHEITLVHPRRRSPHRKYGRYDLFHMAAESYPERRMIALGNCIQ